MRSSSSDVVGAAAVAVSARPRLASPWGRLPATARRILILALLIGAWQAYVSVRHPNPLLFASPWDTARTFWHDLKDGTLATATWTTLKILLEGLAIGAGIGLALTAFATFSKFGDDLLSLLTSILNPLPGVAVLPLAMLWFGITTKALLFVIANSVIWPIAINLSTGFKTVNPTIIAVARNMGISGLRLVTDVLAPAALPHALSGFRTAWAFGWRTIVASELIFGVAGGKGGLGNYINNARFYLDTRGVFAGLVMIALIGFALDLVFVWVERSTVVRWGMKRADETRGVT